MGTAEKPTSSCPEPVRLLDVDPDLGRWLTPDELSDARSRSVVPVLHATPGWWSPPAMDHHRAHFGFLLIEGLLARDELLAGVTSTELLGPGELLQPWTQQPVDPLIPRRVVWTALVPTRLAVLGPSFTAATAPWPALHRALLDRAMHRCEWLSTEHALCQLSRVDERLVVLFWHLAERWGRVAVDGMLVPLRLSHTTLGHLVGAKRPTVTLALRRLADSGLVARRDDGCWVLGGGPEEALRRCGEGSPAGDAVVIALPRAATARPARQGARPRRDDDAEGSSAASSR